MTVFVDTSAIMALLDKDQPDNPQAGRYWAALIDHDATMVTISCVFIEAVALLQARLGLEAVRDFDSLMMPFLDVHWLGGEPHLAALADLLRTDRRKLSFVDVIGLQFMRERSLQHAFSFDKHFAEAGFPLPPLDELPAAQ